MNRVYTGGIGLRAMIAVDDNPNRYKILIDRDTPYKPDGIYRDDRDDEGQYFVFWGKCKCGSAVWDLSKFCDQCGQRLDW